MSTVRTTGPCQIFMNEERCINECPVAEQQRGVCAEPRALALAEAARGKSTVDIGLHIQAFAVSENNGNIYHSYSDKLYYLFDDGITFELCNVGRKDQC